MNPFKPAPVKTPGIDMQAVQSAPVVTTEKASGLRVSSGVSAGLLIACPGGGPVMRRW